MGFFCKFEGQETYDKKCSKKKDADQAVKLEATMTT